MKHISANKKAIGSLIFPVAIFLIFGTLFVFFSVVDILDILRLGCLVSSLIGGLLPTLITFVAKTDTSFYLKNRVLMLLISLILIFIAWVINALLDSICYVWCVFFLSVILSSIYYIRKGRTVLERLIIVISNPVLYLAICLMCFGCDLNIAFTN